MEKIDNDEEKKPKQIKKEKWLEAEMCSHSNFNVLNEWRSIRLSTFCIFFFTSLFLWKWIKKKHFKNCFGSPYESFSSAVIINESKLYPFLSNILCLPAQLIYLILRLSNLVRYNIVPQLKINCRRDENVRNSLKRKKKNIGNFEN